MAFTPFSFANERGLSADAPKSRVPWPFAIACCVYYLLAYRGLAVAAPIFAKLFEELGIEIPFSTRFLMASYWWLYPVVFLGAVILTIVKQFVSLCGARLRVANLSLIFVGVVFIPLAALSYYLPLFVLIHKLQSVK